MVIQNGTFFVFIVKGKKTMNVTENFTLEELYKSSTAEKLKINNTPNEEVKNSLILLATKVLQPLRVAFGKPITVTSGYRSPLLNQAVRGAKTSQHLKGEAADLKCSDNKKLFETSKKLIEEKKIEVGQLIDEYNYSWVHISLPNLKHKNEILHIKK